MESSGRGLSRHSGRLPFVPEKTRGEGSTPLVTEKIDGREVLFKLEYLNPGGSFKDRGSSLAVYYAYRMGYRSVVEDTSGNTGISVVLYSRLYGLRPRIYMPRTAPEGKKRLVRLLGGEIIETASRAEAASEVLREVSTSFYIAHTWSFFYVLGASTIAYEVYEEAGVPDVVLAPVGSGGLFLGLARGFERLAEEGRIERVPRLVAVQGYSSQPLYQALRGYREEGEESTLADGIMVQSPPRLEEIRSVAERYGGEVVLVGNTEIRSALRELLDMGFLVEPTSAAAYAAYKKVRERLEGRRVLIPLTGSGMKMTHELWEVSRA